ncbi:hypothetical protein [Nonomuraea sp. NPDC005692]|uniref:hypothetical protein n=1 Tax=Nonomuraea sp. NPDC005692 TaxID=3157168 RepID=UPI0033C6A702
MAAIAGEGLDDDLQLTPTRQLLTADYRVRGGMADRVAGARGQFAVAGLAAVAVELLQPVAEDA